MRNIDIKMKLKLIVGLIGVLSLSSFSTLPSSDDTDKKEQENWVIGPFHRPEGVILYSLHSLPLSIVRCARNR